MNKLYLIVAWTADADNQDLLVIADTPVNAFLQWEGYYHEDAAEMRADGDVPHNYNPGLIEVNDAVRFTLQQSFWESLDMRIYEINTDLTVIRPLGWNSPDMLLVAYVEEDGE